MIRCLLLTLTLALPLGLHAQQPTAPEADRRGYGPPRQQLYSAGKALQNIKGRFVIAHITPISKGYTLWVEAEDAQTPALPISKARYVTSQKGSEVAYRNLPALLADLEAHNWRFLDLATEADGGYVATFRPLR